MGCRGETYVLMSLNEYDNKMTPGDILLYHISVHCSTLTKEASSCGKQKSRMTPEPQTYQTLFMHSMFTSYTHTDDRA